MGHLAEGPSRGCARMPSFTQRMASAARCGASQATPPRAQEGRRSRVTPSSALVTYAPPAPSRSPGPSLARSPGSSLASPSSPSLTRRATRRLIGADSKSEAVFRRHRFDKRHGAAAETIRTESERLRRTLEERDKAKRWVVRPDKHRWLGAWDTLTSLALVYTATVTPFETCFIESATGAASWTDGWFLSNRVLDVIFGMDMILQFRVAYQSYDKHGTTFWVEDIGQVARRASARLDRGNLLWVVAPLALFPRPCLRRCTKDVYLTQTSPDRHPPLLRRLREDLVPAGRFHGDCAGITRHLRCLATASGRRGGNRQEHGRR